MQPAFNVFVHKEPAGGLKRDRHVIRPGVLKVIDDDKWELYWANKIWIFSETEVLLLVSGGTVPTTPYGRLSISMKVNEAKHLFEYFLDQAKRVVA